MHSKTTQRKTSLIHRNGKVTPDPMKRQENIVKPRSTRPVSERHANHKRQAASTGTTVYRRKTGTGLHYGAVLNTGGGAEVITDGRTNRPTDRSTCSVYKQTNKLNDSQR